MQLMAAQIVIWFPDKGLYPFIFFSLPSNGFVDRFLLKKEQGIFPESRIYSHKVNDITHLVSQI